MITLYDIRTGDLIADITHGPSSLFRGGSIEHNGVRYLVLAIYGLGNLAINVIPWNAARMKLIDANNGKDLCSIAYPKQSPQIGDELRDGDLLYTVAGIGSFGAFGDCVSRVYVRRKAQAAA